MRCFQKESHCFVTLFPPPPSHPQSYLRDWVHFLFSVSRRLFCLSHLIQGADMIKVYFNRTDQQDFLGNNRVIFKYKLGPCGCKSESVRSGFSTGFSRKSPNVHTLTYWINSSDNLVGCQGNNPDTQSLHIHILVLVLLPIFSVTSWKSLHSYRLQYS